MKKVIECGNLNAEMCNERTIKSKHPLIKHIFNLIIIIMKKTLILAGICLSMCLSAFAQNDMGRQNGRMRPNFDAVVDTAVINHIGLDEAVLKKVYELQTTKQAEQREMFQNGMRRERGQRMSEEERQAMQTKRQEFTNQYRQQLRALIGDQLYITYLEKMLDRQSMMRFQRGGFGGGNGQRPGGGQRGGFGGENGGGFGGGNEF